MSVLHDNQYRIFRFLGTLDNTDSAGLSYTAFEDTSKLWGRLLEAQVQVTVQVQ